MLSQSDAGGYHEGWRKRRCHIDVVEAGRKDLRSSARILFTCEEGTAPRVQTAGRPLHFTSCNGSATHRPQIRGLYLQRVHHPDEAFIIKVLECSPPGFSWQSRASTRLFECARWVRFTCAGRTAITSAIRDSIDRMPGHR